MAKCAFLKEESGTEESLGGRLFPSFHYNITATASSSILNRWEYVIFKWKANIDSPYALPTVDTLRWVCCSASWRKWIFAKPLVTVVCRIKNGDENMKRSAQRFLYFRVLCAMRKCYYNFLWNIGCEKVIYSHNGFSLPIGCRKKRTICRGRTKEAKQVIHSGCWE